MLPFAVTQYLTNVSLAPDVKVKAHAAVASSVREVDIAASACAEAATCSRSLFFDRPGSCAKTSVPSTSTAVTRRTSNLTANLLNVLLQTAIIHGDGLRGPRRDAQLVDERQRSLRFERRAADEVGVGMAGRRRIDEFVVFDE